MRLRLLPLLLAAPLLLSSVGNAADVVPSGKAADPKTKQGRRRRPPGKGRVQPQPRPEPEPELETRSQPRPPVRGWKASASSLLLLDEKGALRKELPVGRFFEDLPDGTQVRREARGAAAGGGQFAWHWQKNEIVLMGSMERVLSSRRMLVYLGTDGQVLWDSPLAEAPPGLDPLLASDDGETTLVFERSSGGWSVAGVTFASKRLAEASAGDRIERARLTANGRFAMVFWSRAEQPLTGTFLDLRSGTRYDMPAADVPLAQVVLGEDGSVTAPGKTLYKFP